MPIIGALRDAYRGLKTWDLRRIAMATLAGSAAAVIIGLATVLIPNSLFARDVPPTWWDYPVWLVMSLLIGILFASYVRPSATAVEAESGTAGETEGSTEAAAGAAATTGPAVAIGAAATTGTAAPQTRGGTVGTVGSLLGWFAVGCPVCNKLALLILGYTGALTYFAPLQPVLAALSVVLLVVAVVVRLKGQYSCPVPSPDRSVRS